MTAADRDEHNGSGVSLQNLRGGGRGGEGFVRCVNARCNSLQLACQSRRDSSTSESDPAHQWLQGEPAINTMTHAPQVQYLASSSIILHIMERS